MPYLAEGGPLESRAVLAEMVKDGWEQKAVYRGQRVALLVEAQRLLAALYDIDADPEQQNILSRQEPEELDELLALLEARRAANIAAAPADQGTDATLTESLRRRLESLGYLDSSELAESQPSTSAPAPD